ncbi:MAG: CotH kinase family protein [Coprobacter sp.]|nr:CotH kinase family protein [Coprobacter sp.]
MKFIRILSISVVLYASFLFPLQAQEEVKLYGNIVGSNPSSALKAFDGNPNTYFQGSYSYYYVRNWVGLELDQKYIITKVGIQPVYGDYARFAVIQGANKADFSDAIPIAMFKTALTSGKMNYLDIDVSRGFRYIRVVATDSPGYFAEIEFYGIAGEGDDSKFYQITNLPLVSFNTPGMAQIKSKDDKHPNSYISIVSENGTQIIEDDSVQMKGRGNGSWTFPKKPFQLKFNKKKRVLDAPAKAKKWTLINNYGDRTLMRNKIAFDMSREAGMKYTPYCTFVDVIYNGEYEGAYQLCDQVEVKPGRIEIEEMEATDIDGEALTGGYFIEIDAYANEEKSWFTSNKRIPVTIKSPDDDAITKEQSTYITDFFNQFEAAVFASNYTDLEQGYRKYLDLDSFLRYFILCELDGNIDAFWSMFMWKERGEDLFHVGPIWDIDLGFQNVGNPYPINSLNDFLYLNSNASVAHENMRTLVTRIVKQDAEAKQQMSDIWSDLRHNGNFNAEYFIDKIDEYADILAESQELNFVRWPILNQSVQKSQKVFGSYKGEIDNIKSYLTDRFPKLDALIGLQDKKPVGIDNVTAEPVSGPSILYNLQGQPVTTSHPAPGIYIRKTGSKVEKIIIR